MVPCHRIAVISLAVPRVPQNSTAIVRQAHLIRWSLLHSRLPSGANTGVDLNICKEGLLLNLMVDGRSCTLIEWEQWQTYRGHDSRLPTAALYPL